jgi:hypothetical protein
VGRRAGNAPVTRDRQRGLSVTDGSLEKAEWYQESSSDGCEKLLEAAVSDILVSSLEGQASSDAISRAWMETYTALGRDVASFRVVPCGSGCECSNKCAGM